MSRFRTTKTTTALVLLMSAVLVPASADAGTYDIYTCNANRGGATPGWNVVVHPGFSFYGACTGGSQEGLVARSVAVSGATSSAYEGAFGWIDAPEGTTIASVHGYFYVHRLGCNWGAGLRANSSGDYGGRDIFALQPNYCGTDHWDWAYWDWAVNEKRLLLYVVCGAASCDRSSETRAAARDLKITISDPTPPSLTNARGELWTVNGWFNGTRQVAFDASDGAGIRRNVVRVDDQPVAVFEHGCDDTRPAPCPNQGYTANLDTKKITPDGSHKLTLETVDTAGNPTQISRSIQVDNTVPPAPTGLTVDGGDGWRSANGFKVTWANPAPDGGSPIVAASYRLCRASGGDCVSGAREGSELTSIDGLQLPAAGEWTMTVWLRDAAGNSSSDEEAQVTLRFDPTAPVLAFEAPNPSDPTLVTARATDGESSIAEANIAIRKRGSDTWRTLPSTYENAQISARVPDEHLAAGRYRLRAWAKDAAGNERTTTELAEGGSATMRLPVRVVTQIKAGAASKSIRKRGSAIRARFGRPIRLGGQLRTADGNPISGSEVLVMSRPRRTGAPWKAVASLRTTRKGYFMYRAPRGPSRTIRFRFSGTSTIRPSIRNIHLEVPAKSTIGANRTRLINGEYVRLRGRVLGGTIPPGGKLVEVQVLLRGHWRTFATTRTNEKGRWRHQYRFDGTRGSQTYSMRVRLPEESLFPFGVGTSRALALHVRGL